METPRTNGNTPRAVNGTASLLGGGGGTPANGRTLPFPPSKPINRAPYRPVSSPPPRRPRSRRCCCCMCFLWLILFLIFFLFLAAIAIGIFYLLYHPVHPTFTVSSLRLSALNITFDDIITSRIDFSVTTRNPNVNLALDYEDIAVTAYSNRVAIGDGTIPRFVHGTRSMTMIKVAVSSAGWNLDPTDADDLRNRKGNLPLEIDFDTKVGIWIGRLKTKRIGVQASCGGIEATVVKGNSTAGAVNFPPPVRCKVKFRIKIFTWTIYIK